MAHATHKYAEKLRIVNNHGAGVLTRLYNVKQTYSVEQLRPEFLADKSLHGPIKDVVKKFPQIDAQRAAAGQIFSRKTEIFNNLRPHYELFLDLLDFHDAATELMGSMAGNIAVVDIFANFDMVKYFLDLVVTFFQCFDLLSRFEDRRMVCALYGTTHVMMNGGQMEVMYGRVSQWLIEMDPVIPWIQSRMYPISKIVAGSVGCLAEHYVRSHVTADALRKEKVLSLISDSSHLCEPTQCASERMTMLSMEAMTQYICLGYLCVPHEVNDGRPMQLLKAALMDGYFLPLFREETLPIFEEFEKSFGSYNRGGVKLKKQHSVVQELMGNVLGLSANFHRERREFARHTLRELDLVFREKPALLGPKLVTLLQALCFARDEIYWYCRHQDREKVPAKYKAKAKDDMFLDPQLPELLHLVVSLRQFCLDHTSTVRAYYLEYLGGYDRVALQAIIQTMPAPELESQLLTSFMRNLDLISDPMTLDQSDLLGLRMDWTRLQAMMSVRESPLPLNENVALAKRMNTIVFHALAVDGLFGLLRYTSDVSQLGFHRGVLSAHFDRAVSQGNQARYAISFAAATSSFTEATHDFLPEEKPHIGKHCVRMAVHFLEHVSQVCGKIIDRFCMEHVKFSYETLPIFSVQSQRKGQPTVTADRNRQVTEGKMDQMTMIKGRLVELMWGMEFHQVITVYNTELCPREYLIDTIETTFKAALEKLLQYNPSEQKITRPSQFLQSVRAYMTGLATVSKYIDVQLPDIFVDTLLSQSQTKDKNGKVTLTTAYGSWYLDFFNRLMSSGNYTYSPLRMSFVSDPAATVRAEDYLDQNELRALCELIGPYGVRSIDERLLRLIANEVQQIKGLVITNSDALSALIQEWQETQKCQENVKRLKQTDELMQRTVFVGYTLCFRQLLMRAQRAVTHNHVPFVSRCVNDMRQYVMGSDPQALDRLATAAGLECEVDPLLREALAPLCQNPQQDEKVWMALLYFYAVSLPSLMTKETSYKPSLEALDNNAHCVATAINKLSSTLLVITSGNDTRIAEGQTEFLRVASAGLLNAATHEKAKDRPEELESLFTILHKFVEESAFLTAGTFELAIPYPILQGAYAELYKKKKKKGKEAVQAPTE